MFRKLVVVERSCSNEGRVAGGNPLSDLIIIAKLAPHVFVLDIVEAWPVLHIMVILAARTWERLFAFAQALGRRWPERFVT